MKKKNIIRGKKARASGQRFELKTRKDLEEKGWICDKWSNNVDLDKGKLIPAKHKFRGKGIPMAIGTGFPDFIAYTFEININHKHLNGELIETKKVYEIIGVECKSLGYLDKEEKEKCRWLIKHKVFSKIIIASRGKKRGTIKYKEFE